MKIVLDTNLLIDGESDDYNYGSRIIDAVLEGKIEAFANQATLRENKLMARKKIHDEAYLEKVYQFFESVQLAPNVDHRLHVVEDPQDNKILESAVVVEADYLVTSDKHLLKIENYKNIKIVNPSQFWNVYQENTGDAWDSWMKQFIGK